MSTTSPAVDPPQENLHPKPQAPPAEPEKPAEAKPRKSYTPKVDAVIEAIKRGEYDDQILDLHNAIGGRQDILKQKVLEEVKAIFGEDAVIISPGSRSNSGTTPAGEIATDTPAKANPFMAKAAAKVPEVQFEAGVEYRTNPSDNNAYRIDSVDAGFVFVVDVQGGHQVRVPKFQWDSWDIVQEGTLDPDEAGNLDARLDDVEAKMAAEAATRIETAAQPAPATQVHVDIERRGAVIAGLHPSDMGN